MINTKICKLIIFKLKNITKNEYYDKFTLLILIMGFNKHINEDHYDYNFELCKPSK